MEEALRALLTSSAVVTAITPEASINWGSRVQGLKGPQLVLNVISDAEGHTLKSRDGLSVGRVQIDCYAETNTQAKQLSRAVRALLDGFRDSGFRGVFHAGTRDGREGGTNDADRPFRVSLDFMTHWRN